MHGNAAAIIKRDVFFLRRREIDLSSRRVNARHLTRTHRTTATTNLTAAIQPRATGRASSGCSDCTGSSIRSSIAKKWRCLAEKGGVSAEGEGAPSSALRNVLLRGNNSDAKTENIRRNRCRRRRTEFSMLLSDYVFRFINFSHIVYPVLLVSAWKPHQTLNGDSHTPASHLRAP